MTMAELEKEILELLQETRADFASIQKGMDECLAIVKETNVMLAARRQAIAAREWV